MRTRSRLFVSLRLRKRPVAWLAAAAATLLCAALVWSALRAASPRLSFAFSPADNRLVLRAQPGSGPLRLWVYRRMRWGPNGARVKDVPVLAETLRPGQQFQRQVVLAGPVPVRRTVRLTVPALPTYAVDRTTDSEVEIESSQPLAAVAGLTSGTGSWLPSDPRIVELNRGPQARTLHLAVQTRSGERADWKVRVPAVPAVPVVWFGPPSGARVYLTIDDGWVPSSLLLSIMRTEHVPITAFLVERAAAAHRDYWRAFAAAGGLIEDHTVSHPRLTALPFSSAEAEWSGPIEQYPQWFGVTAPTLGRPPYGATNATVEEAARAAGLREIVMWDAQWTQAHGLATWNGGPLRAGDIILMHWVPGVGRAVQALLPTLAREHLHPALLPLAVPSPDGRPPQAQGVGATPATVPGD